MNEEELRQQVIAKWLKNPQRPWSLIAKDFKLARSSVQSILTKYRQVLSTRRHPHNHNHREPRNPRLHNKIVRTITGNPSMSIRDVARKCTTSVGMVQRTKKREDMKTYKKQKIPRTSEKQQTIIKSRARKLYDYLGREKLHVVMDDETYVKTDFSVIPGQQFYTVSPGQHLPRSQTTIQTGKFDEKYLVWQAICECGEKSTVFVTKGTMNAQIYKDECLKKRLLPLIRKHDVPTLFWPDLATAHYAKTTLEFMDNNSINYVKKAMNPPNVPQCRPIERYWSQVKGILRKTGHVTKTIEEFRRKWYAAARKVKKESVKVLMMDIRKKLRQEYQP